MGANVAYPSLVTAGFLRPCGIMCCQRCRHLVDREAVPGDGTRGNSAPSQWAEGSMAWLIPTDTEIAALIGARIDVVAFDVDVIDATGGREAVA